MAGVFPTRDKPFWTYLPLISIASLFWWITGLGVWIHYTQEAANQAKNLISILQLVVSSGPQSQVSKIQSSMIATSIVYVIFAIAMHALGLYRGLVEQQQDMQGQVYEIRNMYLLWANIAIQIGWWVITLWIIVLGVGFGAFAACVYIMRSAINNTLLMQALAGTQPVPLPNACPFECLDVTSTGIFFYSTSIRKDIVFCICDQPTLLAANKAVQDCYTAVPAMLVGMLLMAVYGVVLLTYLVNMMVRLNLEASISERMEEQGFVVGATIAAGPKHQQAAPKQQAARTSNQQRGGVPGGQRGGQQWR